MTRWLTGSPNSVQISLNRSTLPFISRFVSSQKPCFSASSNPIAVASCSGLTLE